MQGIGFEMQQGPLSPASTVNLIPYALYHFILDDSRGNTFIVFLLVYVEFNPLRQRQTTGPVNGAGLPAHIGFPNI